MLIQFEILQRKLTACCFGCFELALYAAIFCGGVLSTAYAADLSVPRVDGDDLRALFGDGTGVIVGIVDSGVDDTHPMLTGLDSQGLSRLVAEANFVTTEPTNTGDDVHGHGTGVAGVALGNDSTYAGIATDARYINARVLDSSNGFNTSSWVINGAGFAADQGADVINMSLGFFSSGSDGNNSLARMADYLVFSRGIVVTVSAGNDGNDGAAPDHVPNGPADGYNVFSVASTLSNSYDRITSSSSWGPLEDGRIKPDIAAPGVNIRTANDDWETSNDYRTWSGTSFAAPHVAGFVASQIDYGRANGLSTHPLVIRSTMMNATEKVNDRDDNPWEYTESELVDGVLEVSSSLDNHSGAGQINGMKLYEQYSAGMQGPGFVDPVGWDLNTINDEESLFYDINETLEIGSEFVVTLTWLRHMDRTDNGDGLIGAGDSFFQTEELDDLDITLLVDNEPVAWALSTVDNTEHLVWTVDTLGLYTIQVDRYFVSGSGNSELYSLAWMGTGTGVLIPEPTVSALMLSILVMRLRKRR